LYISSFQSHFFVVTFMQMCNRQRVPRYPDLKKIILVVMVLMFVCRGPVSAHASWMGSAGLQEKPGNVIPADLTFYDETGRKVNLRDMVNRPTMLAVVYYRCAHMCPQFLEGLAISLGKLPLVPGKDYRVVTVSFDDKDTPELAQSVKRNYIKAIDRPFPDDAWRFLSGSGDNARRLCEALGISVMKSGHGFIHPEVLIFLAPGGRITRYMQVSRYDYGLSYPITFTDFELSQAIGEAGQGKVCTVGGTVPLYCFAHEPSGQEAFFTIMKITGAVTLLMILSLFFYLRREENLRKRRIELGRHDGR
jgi:protein SCO1/2